MPKAIQIREFGGPEVMQLVEVEVGDPGPTEVRIRHEACGLNFIDTYQRSGAYKVPLPLMLGMEAAGIVEAVGDDVSHIEPGDRVAYASQPPGAYCEVRVMPAQNVVRLPDGVDFETGAAMMLKGLTVQYLLRKTQPQGGLQEGDFIVFHAAAGGVGLIACQWAKAMGLQLIGTAGSPEKCQRALDHGAAHMIDYRSEDFVERVKEITGGRGVKVVYDSVGKDTFAKSIECLRPFGLAVSFGNASGAPDPVATATLAKGSLWMTRPTLFTHMSSREATQEMADDLFEMVNSGALKIEVERRYPLAEAAQAHRDMESRQTTGSSVLIP